jgi:hypothetical protein
VTSSTCFVSFFNSELYNWAWRDYPANIRPALQRIFEKFQVRPREREHVTRACEHALIHRD